MRERGGGQRGNCVIRNTISVVIHTPLYMSEREGVDGETVYSETPSLCTCVSEEGDDGESVYSEIPSLCTYVNEEGGDGDGVCSETPSLMSLDDFITSE